MEESKQKKRRKYLLNGKCLTVTCVGKEGMSWKCSLQEHKKITNKHMEL